MELTTAQRQLGLVTDGEWGPITAAAIASAVRTRTQPEYLCVKLSKHFELRELLVSSTAARRGISNLPDASQLLSMVRLCTNVLELVRTHYGKAVIVTSGLRSAKLNRAVGGSRTSQHCFGEAADFTVAGVSNRAVCKWIEGNCSFDQLIYEFGENGWIHCSFGPRCRKQTLSASKGRFGTKYTAGI